MGVFDNFGWQREPIEDWRAERRRRSEREQTYRDCADELRAALAYRDQLLLEQDERIETLQHELGHLQNELAETEISLTIAEAENDSKAAKLADAAKWARQADEVFAQQQSVIDAQESAIAELSEQAEEAQRQNQRWQKTAEKEKERSGKLTEIIVELVQTVKTGRALASDFPARLEAAGLKVKGLH